MGILSGILSLICFCLLSSKAVTSKLHFKKMDKLLFKIHKPVSVFFIITSFVHIFSVVPILKNRNFLIVIAGIISIAFMVLLICFCHMLNDRKKKIFWHRILTILMAIGIIWHFTAYIIDFHNYQKEIANITINDINLENAENGIYRGTYDVGYIYAEVEVEIKNGVIVSIRLLKHRNEQGKHAEEIINKIVSAQKIDVDAISGATNSSKVIKKAVEKAITNEKSGPLPSPE